MALYTQMNIDVYVCARACVRACVSLRVRARVCAFVCYQCAEIIQIRNHFIPMIHQGVPCGIRR